MTMVPANDTTPIKVGPDRADTELALHFYKQTKLPPGVTCSALFDNIILRVYQANSPLQAPSGALP